MNIIQARKSRFSIPVNQNTNKTSSSSSSSGSGSPTSPKKDNANFSAKNQSPFKKIEMLKKIGRDRSNSVTTAKLPSLLERRSMESTLFVDTKEVRRGSVSKASGNSSARVRDEDAKKSAGVGTPRGMKSKDELLNPLLVLPASIRDQVLRARESSIHESSFTSQRIATEQSGGGTDRDILDTSIQMNPKVKKCFHAVYFLGIMLSFRNRVRMIAELRAQDTNKEDIELVEEKRKSFFPILPTTSFSLSWTMLMTGLILLVSIITPFHVSFIDDSNQIFDMIELTMNVIFGLDILVNFVSAYYDPRVGLVTSWKKILINYMTFWFWVDVVSIIPFDVIILDLNSNRNSTSYNKLLRLLRFPRLYKLLKILRLFKVAKLLSTNQNAGKFMKKINVNWGIITVIKTFVKLFFLNHLVSCFWFYIARMNDYNPETWVYRMGLVDSDPWTQYVASFYWAFQTLATVGYGDIPPVTDGERIIAILWMMVGVGFYSFTIEKISSILANLDRRSQILKKKMNAFNQFALRVNLSNYLKQKVQRYFELNHKENVSCWIDPPNMIEELPSNLRWGLLLFSYHQMIKNIKLLQQDGNFTANIVSHLKMLKLNKNEILYREEENSEESGVKLLTEDGEGIFSFVEGTYFGEIEILEGSKRKYFCQATQPTLLLVCPKKVFLTNIKKFTDVQTQVEKTYSLRIEKIKSKLLAPEPGLNTSMTNTLKTETLRSQRKTKKKLLKANDFFYQVILRAHEKKNKSFLNQQQQQLQQQQQQMQQSVNLLANQSENTARNNTLNNTFNNGSHTGTNMGLKDLYASPKATIIDQNSSILTLDRSRLDSAKPQSFQDHVMKIKIGEGEKTNQNNETQGGMDESKQGQGEGPHSDIQQPADLHTFKKKELNHLVIRAKINALVAASEVNDENTKPEATEGKKPVEIKRSNPIKLDIEAKKDNLADNTPHLKSPASATRTLKIKMNDIVKSGKIVKEADLHKDDTPSLKPIVPTLPLNKINSVPATPKLPKIDPTVQAQELATKDPKTFLKNYKGTSEDKFLIVGLIESFNKITALKADCERKLKDLENKKSNFANQFSTIGERQLEIQRKVDALLDQNM